MSEEAPNVFAYLDYRAFLRDYYAFKKAGPRAFSYRAFSRRAGLRSPNYLKLVIDGKRNLTSAMSVTFAETCGLEGEAQAFFVDLVAFNQATTGPERTAAYDRLKNHREYRKVQTLELAHAAYHSTWYMPAVRELAARPDFRDDANWIAERLRPRISMTQAAKALRTLKALGMLTRDPETGRTVQSETLVSTGAETSFVHIGRYHRMMIKRGAASIDEFPAPQRDISSLTLCLGEDKLAEVKERIARFRRELLELSADDPRPQQVVQINFQLFPLSDAHAIEDVGVEGDE